MLALRRAPAGQGLLEVIVAITVLLIISISITALTIQTLSIHRLVRERTVAVGLAAEGVEWARSVRDSNWIRNDATVPWDTGLSSATEYIAVIGWDPSQRKLLSDFSGLDASDISGTDSLLYRTECPIPLPGCVAGVYTMTATNNTPTIFHRLVSLWPICMDLSGTLAQQAASETTVTLEGQGCVAPNTKVGVAVHTDVQYRDGRQFTVSAEERLYNWREGSPL